VHTLILHNVRSSHNVGSMFRTADAAGISHIILSGYTPGPVDPHGKVRKEFVKVSLGAEQYIPWERTAKLSTALKKLKKEGSTIIAVEQNKNSTSLFDYQPRKGPLTIVMGNEVRGLSKQALALCDAIVEIPMKGKKESLNVSVACGVVLFTLLK
jgi:23S rRNA (guanosine2251-2'-O)-methyltransferase